MKVITVLGARPQFVKSGPVSRAFERAGIVEVRVHTGQHYDDALSDVFFRELGLGPCAHHLGVGSGPHGAQTGRMMEALERVVLDEAPDHVLVYGDTNSTLAGALVAAKLRVPLAHVEAGLRSFNRAMPEEINRVLTDHAADVLFAPTSTARANLLREGIEPTRIAVVGDVMYDAALGYAPLADARRGLLDALGVRAGAYVLATVHRAENTDRPARLAAIAGGLADAAREIDVVFPLHPRTRAALGVAGIVLDPAIRVTGPLGYLDMMALERGARLVVTDSGGVQKEAYFHGVPCLTLRDETEWTELVAAGWNRLCPPASAAHVARAIRARLADAPPAPAPALYGDGHAAERIAARLLLPADA